MDKINLFFTMKAKLIDWQQVTENKLIFYKFLNFNLITADNFYHVNTRW